MTEGNMINIHHEKLFKEINQIFVPLEVSTSEDPIEVLKLKISKNEKYMAVLSGKNLVKEMEEIHSLHVYL